MVALGLLVASCGGTVAIRYILPVSPSAAPTSRTTNQRRNWLEGFEKHGFITAIHGDTVEFDYQGLHHEIFSMIHPPDVQWAAQRMQRITDAQWRDAFRAANYADGDAERFIHRLEEKIDDGLALRARPVARDTR